MDREMIIKCFEFCRVENKCSTDCPYWDNNSSTYNCTKELAKDVLTLLKKQEARELTIDEWREWKANSKRNPICILWENDTSPMWILNPNDVHEPALLMGKLKLFTGKPTFEQCKEMKWE